ncbi:hypothetical protein BYT27DRAFT_7237733 [Phlegmacium glaucopus]|nr:hypothetical protein BYT27DRAFT_7237733 [Phlegmacium glaucopus]
MLGKMSAVTTIVENLRNRSLVQGQTHRWAVGWSFIDMHLPDTFFTEIFACSKVYPQLTEIQDPLMREEKLHFNDGSWKLLAVTGSPLKNPVTQDLFRRIQRFIKYGIESTNQTFLDLE